MADQRTITMSAGDATPETVVLRALPVADVPADSVCYMYPVVPYSGLSGDAPGTMTLRENEVTPTDIRLMAPSDYAVAAANVVITMRDPMVAGGEAPPAPPGTYYGILKRWSGAAWVKAALKRWAGAAWIAAALKRWTGTEWVLVDTTGV